MRTESSVSTLYTVSLSPQSSLLITRSLLVVDFPAPLGYLAISVHET